MPRSCSGEEQSSAGVQLVWLAEAVEVAVGRANVVGQRGEVAVRHFVLLAPLPQGGESGRETECQPREQLSYVTEGLGKGALLRDSGRSRPHRSRRRRPRSSTDAALSPHPSEATPATAGRHTRAGAAAAGRQVARRRGGAAAAEGGLGGGGPGAGDLAENGGEAGVVDVADAGEEVVLDLVVEAAVQHSQHPPPHRRRRLHLPPRRTPRRPSRAAD